jgi:hypothetical protein
MANFDPISLLHKIKAMKGRLTRLDLALDIFDNPKLLPSIFDASRPSVWEQRIVSRLRFEKPMPVGWENETIYFNRRTDETCICCYDKAKEQNIEGVWTRLEFRSRNRKLLANVLAELTAGRAVGQVTARLLGDYLKFVGPGDGNKYRKPVATWWAKVIKEGQGFEFQRHSLGKLDEDGNEHNSPKKCGKTVDQVTRYLKDACRYADLGMMDEIGTVFAQIRYDKQLEIELEKMW